MLFLVFYPLSESGTSYPLFSIISPPTPHHPITIANNFPCHENIIFNGCIVLLYINIAIYSTKLKLLSIGIELMFYYPSIFTPNHFL